MKPDDFTRFECLKLALSCGEDPTTAVERAKSYYGFVTDESEPSLVRVVNIANLHPGNDTVH